MIKYQSPCVLNSPSEWIASDERKRKCTDCGILSAPTGPLCIQFCIHKKATWTMIMLYAGKEAVVASRLLNVGWAAGWVQLFRLLVHCVNFYKRVHIQKGADCLRDVTIMTWYFDIKTFKKQRQHHQQIYKTLTKSTNQQHTEAQRKREGSIIQVQGRMAHNKMHIKGTIVWKAFIWCSV